eukprot:851283-Prymnesium_polylepis.1
MLAALQQVQAHAETLQTQLNHAQASVQRERDSAAAAQVRAGCTVPRGWTAHHGWPPPPAATSSPLVPPPRLTSPYVAPSLIPLPLHLHIHIPLRIPLRIRCHPSPAVS